MNDMDTLLARLAELILRHDDTLIFTALEVGAAPIGGPPERSHRLLDYFPGSRVFAFEVDEALCKKLNRESPPGIRFFAKALGRAEEKRPFYETLAPMCSSLYEPNKPLLSLYNEFELADLVGVREIETVSLDHFAEEQAIGPVDFIKIDVQGAELDIFQGGCQVLGEVVAIVSEVEFIPHYVNQPLFGDVCTQLRRDNIMFHKFLTRGTRSLAPIVLNNDPTVGTQDIWADALFIRDVVQIPQLSAKKLLKLGMLAQMYDSPDLAFYCFRHYDALQGTNLQGEFAALFSC